ncbi:hypothetical protein [Pseudomonas kulmbachensis]|uniref:Integrase n=1 Tax=Pseudomonas kulmbachensis TaxID=3043408 RepID=A0ABW7LY96_9PSED
MFSNIRDLKDSEKIDEEAIGIDFGGLIFPLASSHPIITIIQADGSHKVVSRYQDQFWDFTDIAGQITKVYFFNKNKKTKYQLSDGNWEILRAILAYIWLAGHRSINYATLFNYAKNLRALLGVCSAHKLEARELYKHPDLAKKIFEIIPGGKRIIKLMYELYANRHVLGFYLMGPETLRDVSRVLLPFEHEQTPYIPTRIWNYQANRLTEFLQDFINNLDCFKRLFNCLFLLYKEFGYSESRKEYRKKNVSPFNRSTKNWQYLGDFNLLTYTFQIRSVLEKWMVVDGRSLAVISKQSGPRILSTYFTAVCYVGLIYLGNFSGMRSKELLALNSTSIECDEDELFGKIYFLISTTTKTIADNRASWVTTPFSAEVVKALSEISNMRVSCAMEFNRGKVDKSLNESRSLFMKAFEPWGLARGDALDIDIGVTAAIRYGNWSSYCPNLFDESDLTITESDFLEAKKVTPTLNPDRFAVGEVWPLAIHQLRRTLIVNALEDGVSIFSVQYQAKHQALMMSKYYGRGQRGRPMSNEMQMEFMGEVHSAIVQRVEELNKSNFVSVYGDGHKSRLIEFIDISNTRSLIKGATDGSYSIRETFYGICLKKGFCSSGGISFLGDCPSCELGLGDKNKIPTLAKIKDQIKSFISESVMNNQLHASLKKQLQIVTDAIVFLES